MLWKILAMQFHHIVNKIKYETFANFVADRAGSYRVIPAGRKVVLSARLRRDCPFHIIRVLKIFERQSWTKRLGTVDFFRRALLKVSTKCKAPSVSQVINSP